MIHGTKRTRPPSRFFFRLCTSTSSSTDIAASRIFWKHCGDAPAASPRQPGLAVAIWTSAISGNHLAVHSACWKLSVCKSNILPQCQQSMGGNLWTEQTTLDLSVCRGTDVCRAGLSEVRSELCLRVDKNVQKVEHAAVIKSTCFWPLHYVGWLRGGNVWKGGSNHS